MDVRININTINEINNELLYNIIKDKHSYYINSVIKRFDKCNDQYVKEFDNELNNILKDINDNKFSLNKLSKLIKLSNNISNSVYNNYVIILKTLLN